MLSKIIDEPDCVPVKYALLKRRRRNSLFYRVAVAMDFNEAHKYPNFVGSYPTIEAFSKGDNKMFEYDTGTHFYLPAELGFYIFTWGGI